MSSPLTGLGCALPVLAAPMAGGPGTPALVTDAAAVGGLGFLAAGYKPPQAVAAELAEVRSAGVPFGINLFAPNPVPVDAAAFRRYATAISAEGDRYGLDLANAEGGRGRRRLGRQDRFAAGQPGAGGQLTSASRTAR